MNACFPHRILFFCIQQFDVIVWLCAWMKLVMMWQNTSKWNGIVAVCRSWSGVIFRIIAEYTRPFTINYFTSHLYSISLSKCNKKLLFLTDRYILAYPKLKCNMHVGWMKSNVIASRVCHWFESQVSVTFS